MKHSYSVSLNMFKELLVRRMWRCYFLSGTATVNAEASPCQKQQMNEEGRAAKGQKAGHCYLGVYEFERKLWGDFFF